MGAPLRRPAREAAPPGRVAGSRRRRRVGARAGGRASRPPSSQERDGATRGGPQTSRRRVPCPVYLFWVAATRRTTTCRSRGRREIPRALSRRSHPGGTPSASTRDAAEKGSWQGAWTGASKQHLVPGQAAVKSAGRGGPVVEAGSGRRNPQARKHTPHPGGPGRPGIGQPRDRRPHGTCRGRSASGKPLARLGPPGRARQVDDASPGRGAWRRGDASGPRPPPPVRMASCRGPRILRLFGRPGGATEWIWT
jgi:hypothetical protein